MSVNAQIAERLEQIAQILELLGEDRFRVAANAKAARVVADLTTDLAALADDREALLAIEGIGTKTADKIVEFVKTGRITEHEELRAQVPPGLLDLLRIPGLGPKTVAMLWKEAGVTDLAALKRIIDDGSILELPRMGAKTVENVRKSIEFAGQTEQRIPLGIALPIAEEIVERMRAVPGVKNAAFAGSLRRGKETIGDIDILVATTDPDAAHEAFTTIPGVVQVLASGGTKSSVRLRAAHDLGRWTLEGQHGKESGGVALQADLRAVDPSAWGAAIMYFTGSKEHNVRLRELALKKGCTLNEYGLYHDDNDKTPPQRRGVKPIASRTEQAVYAKLALPFIPPEIREDRAELELTETPRLIELTDVKAELHAHTTASDGSLELHELVAEAKRRGFHTIAVTDHSKSSVVAGGLDETRLAEQREQVEALRESTKGLSILCGSEVDILGDGRLDFDDETLAALDVVVASPHVALKQDPKAATKRLIRAIENPFVHVLGHPTGRLINRRPGLTPDMAEVIAAAKQHGVALEINAHWMRLDLRDTHVRAAVEAGCLIAINCDVHAAPDFDNLRYGILTARRGWLPPDQCVNCWPAKRLRDWLATRRPT
ncbi:MAG TPA: DNA polymerase/3'-5' exonuclease PolX [Phycisphaerales bacterium]|nr:DNA polymerase/3'-5' exonuclease PolX [Phycisphaerales bacterium]